MLFLIIKYHLNFKIFMDMIPMIQYVRGGGLTPSGSAHQNAFDILMREWVANGKANQYHSREDG